jgi:hypothetical protein
MHSLVAHYAANKNITQSPFHLYFFELWNDQIVKQHLIHSIQIYIFLITWAEVEKLVLYMCEKTPNIKWIIFIVIWTYALTKKFNTDKEKQKIH